MSARFDICPKRACAWTGCGKSFEVSCDARNQLYCTRACSRAAYAARTAVERELRTCITVGCGKTFDCPTRSRQRCCSDNCQKKQRYRGRIAAAGKGVRAHRCMRCGGVGHQAKTCPQPKPDRARTW